MNALCRLCVVFPSLIIQFQVHLRPQKLGVKSCVIFQFCMIVWLFLLMSCYVRSLGALKFCYSMVFTSLIRSNILRNQLIFPSHNIFYAILARLGSIHEQISLFESFSMLNNFVIFINIFLTLYLLTLKLIDASLKYWTV